MKRLFYFPSNPTDVGVMPAYYDEVPECFAADAIKAGGRDVTMQPGAWEDFNSQLMSENMNYL